METKTGTLLVEDRDLGYLFLDPAGIDEANEGTPVTIEIADGVRDWEDEDAAVWLTDETGTKLRVVPRDAVWSEDAAPGDEPLIDFEKDGFPIPTPVVIADAAAWAEHKADMGE